MERELNYCKQFLRLKKCCNDKIMGMQQCYTGVKIDNTSSSLISLRFTHLNEQTLGIWPRWGFQAKKSSGCGDQWLPAERSADVPAGDLGFGLGAKGGRVIPQEEKSYRVNSAEKTDLKLSLGFQEERVDELVLLGNIWEPAGLEG